MSVEAMKGVMRAVKREDKRLTLWLSSSGRPAMCFTSGPGLSTTFWSLLLYPEKCMHTYRKILSMLFCKSAWSQWNVFLPVSPCLCVNCLPPPPPPTSVLCECVCVHVCVCACVCMCNFVVVDGLHIFISVPFIHACLTAEMVNTLHPSLSPHLNV